MKRFYTKREITTMLKRINALPTKHYKLSKKELFMTFLRVDLELNEEYKSLLNKIILDREDIEKIVSIPKSYRIAAIQYLTIAFRYWGLNNCYRAIQILKHL